jgi:methylphosphotriester-DNA--protein-cysteine methyltransferase
MMIRYNSFLPKGSQKNSNIYHKSNCPEISKEDLMEFISSQKAREAGGVPCKNCNP